MSIRHLAAVLPCVLLAACPDPQPAPRPDATVSDVPTDVASEPAACTTCPALFGRPVARTGLTAAQCRPSCDADGGTFAPPAYGDAFIRSLVTDWRLETPYPDLAGDPYAGTPMPVPDPPDTVCAVVPTGDAGAVPRPYRLETFPSEAAARAAGARPTHFGHCGVCSTLANLAVYLRENDLSSPVQACGLVGFTDGGDANLACLMALGFDRPCAQIWYYNTVHTREQCLSLCFTMLNRPYHLPDGTLNPCYQCDEDRSGPVFKDVAGRTRRNAGLPNAICRPCAEVRPLVHAY